MRKCRYFNTCNAPTCPLDPDMNLRVYIKGDSKCKLDKRTRKLLGKNLPNKGLLPKEINYENAWKKRTNESRYNTYSNIGKFAFKNIKLCVDEGGKK